MSTRSVTPFIEDTRLTLGPLRSLPPLYILRCTKNTVFEHTVVVTLLSSIKSVFLEVSYHMGNTMLKSSVTYRISEVRLPKNKVIGYTLNTRQIDEIRHGKITHRR